MTLEEADAQIHSSRHLLLGWIALGISDRPIEVLGTISQEIAELETIATLYPRRAPILVALVVEWIALRDAIKAKMH